jgi:ATP/maltotriose-dependent transcriptional regulator MalT
VGLRHQDPVGRGPELERLGEVLDDLQGGVPTCVVVEGEPGIGKTWLLSELRRRAEGRGHLVLSGSAAEFERDLPFGVWVDALDAYVAAQDLSSRGDVDPEWLADLSGVLPSLRGTATAPGLGDERHRAHRALRALLDVIADDKPLVLVLDDLHWSDAASIEVLAALLRRGAGERVLLALGYRSGKAPAKLASALAAPAVTIIELGPLSEPECSQLAGEQVPAEQLATIYAQSGGNPFYTLQLAHASALPLRTSTGDHLALDAGVPRVVAAALVEELEALTAEARMLLRAGAIAGDPFEPELAYAIAELSRQAGISALDELLDERLLHATDVPRRFAFRHPLVRRAVYASSKGGWRLAAHARAAQALAVQRASAAARAHHVEQSGVQGEQASIALLLEAGDADASRAPAGAARWYAAALRLMPDDDRSARLHALMKLAQVRQATGDLTRCLATLLEAIDLVPGDDLALRLRLTSACAACENFLGRHAVAERRLNETLDALPDKGSREAVAVLLDLATGAFFTVELERMCDMARRGLAAARALGEPALVGAAAAVLAHGCATAGLVAEASSNADEAGARLDDLPDDTLALYLDTVSRLAWAEYLIERFDDSIRHAARGAAVARATGQGQFTSLILAAQGLSTTIRGDLSAATALHDEAMEAADVAANDYVTSGVLTATANSAMSTGDLDRARRAAEQAVACVAGVEGGHLATMARVRLAVTLHELGASAAEIEDLVASAGGWGLPLIPPTWRVAYTEAMARIELERGRLDQAVACAESAEAAAAQLGLPLATAVGRRARARVLLGCGQAGAAAELALASAAGAERAGAPVEAGRSRVLAGTALAAAGDRDRAVGLLRGAERDLDARGALRDRGEARRQMRQLGARTEPRGPSGAAGGGIESLSRREHEIAALVTARKTNKEVAAELFLSEKTVESHLRNIFAKLGASSRVDVARAVERSTSAK